MRRRSLYFRNFGLRGKQSYYEWCLENRREKLTKLITLYCPKIVICAGLTQENIFISTLFSEAIAKERNKFCGDKKRYARYELGETNIFIIPALTGGRYSLNSYDAVEEMGNIISNYIPKVSN